MSTSFCSPSDRIQKVFRDDVGGYQTGNRGWEVHASFLSTRTRYPAVPRIGQRGYIGIFGDILRHYRLSPAVVFSCPVDPIDEAWARVEAEWGDENAHRRFVGVCVALDRLPEAGKRYREVRETDPARRDDAAKQIDTLIVLATQQLQDTRVQPANTEHKRTLTWAAFFIMLVLMGAGTLLLMRG